MSIRPITCATVVFVATALLAFAPVHPAAAAARTVPAPDLVVSVATSPTQVNTQDPLVYRFTVTNTGPVTAPAAAFADDLPLPSGGVTTSRGACSLGPAAYAVRCALGDLEPAASVLVEITVRPTDTGTLTNTASVSSASPDSNVANNATTASTYVYLGRPLPASCDQVAPAGCTTWITATASQQVTLALRPSASFEGSLTATIRDVATGAVFARVTATYAAGRLVAGSQSVSGVLMAGDWSLAVNPDAASVGGGTTPRCFSFFRPCGGFGPSGVILPAITVPAVIVPEAIGPFGATVSAD